MPQFPMKKDFDCWPSIFGFAFSWPGCVPILIVLILLGLVAWGMGWLSFG